MVCSPVTRLLNDVNENVHRFNQEEALWRCYEEKRRQRRSRLPLSFSEREELLDQLDWLAAERETRSSDCIGKSLT